MLKFVSGNTPFYLKDDLCFVKNLTNNLMNHKFLELHCWSIKNAEMFMKACWISCSNGYFFTKIRITAVSNWSFFNNLFFFRFTKATSTTPPVVTYSWTASFLIFTHASFVQFNTLKCVSHTNQHKYQLHGTKLQVKWYSWFLMRPLETFLHHMPQENVLATCMRLHVRYFMLFAAFTLVLTSLPSVP